MKTTIVTFVLDRSGSMARTKQQTIVGYNEHVQQVRENAKDQDIKVCLVSFNGEVFEHLWLQDPEKLLDTNENDYTPKGATAMRDALGYTVTKLLETTEIDDPETSHLVYVISDGMSDDDQHWTPAATRELVQSCEATGRWTFAYLGCSKECLNRVAAETGIATANMGVWDNTTAVSASNGMRMSNRRSQAYFDDRKLGVTSKCNFMNDSVGTHADFTQAAPVPDSASWPNLLNTGSLNAAPQAQPVQAAATAVPLGQLADKYRGSYRNASEQTVTNGVFSNWKKVQMVKKQA